MASFLEEVRSTGANAVVGFRFTASEEERYRTLIMYGTAVVVQ